MAKNVGIYNASVTASKTYFPVSNPFSLKNRYAISVFIEVSAVVETNAITFDLMDSFDGGVTWAPVGSEASVAVTKQSLASASDINHSTETFTKTAHGFVTGQKLIFKAGTAAPTGLVDGPYYAIRVDADNFRLSATQAGAYAGTLQTFSSNGTGNQIFAPAVYQIRMVETDSSDIAQLPLEDMVMVTATTGVSDTCTVSAVWLAENA